MYEGLGEYPSLADYPVSYENIGNGFTAIVNTVGKMAKVIRESARNIRIRSLAATIVSDVAEKDQAAEVQAILSWVHDHTRYLKDIQGVETLHSPLVMLDVIEQGLPFQGDCDDLNTMTLSLLKSIGYPVRIRIAAYKTPGKFTHVYGLVKIKNEWTPVESIEKNAPVGWQHPGAIEVKDYEV